MAKANSSFSEVQIARRIKEGRGQGHGKDYVNTPSLIHHTHRIYHVNLYSMGVMSLSESCGLSVL